MPSPTEEDAPTMMGTPGPGRADEDEPATTSVLLGPSDEDDDEEGRTVLQQAALGAPAVARPAGSPRAAASDLGAGGVIPDDDLEDSITGTPTALGARIASLMIPGSVEIRTVEHDDLLDETEVRTRPGHLPPVIPEALRAAATAASSAAPRPAAGVPASTPAPSEPDLDDEGVTQLSPAARAPSLAHALDAGEPSTRPRVDAPDHEAYEDDSVTTQAPALADAEAMVGSLGLSGPRRATDPFEDSTDGMTQKRGREPVAEDVIADRREDEDDLPENRTVVMANAPLKQAIEDALLPSFRAPLAPGPVVVGDRASLGGLHLGERVSSSIVRTTADSSGPMDVRAQHAPTEQFIHPLPAPSGPPAELAPPPRYGLLVAVVAAISILVPVALFLGLNYASDDAGPAAVAPSQPESELQRREPPRGKLDRSGRAAAPSATASTGALAASGSASVQKPPPRFPFKR